ncbi:hypothetical protein GCM10020331_008450 [Ectobacillus funiculus]
MTGSNHIIKKNKIHILYPSFTNSEQKVAQTVLPTGADVIYFSITELASTAAVVEATILRFFADGSLVQAIRNINYPTLKH